MIWERSNMTQQNEQHFHLHDSNKAKAYEEQKEMRKDLKYFVSYFSFFELQKLYKEMKLVKKYEKNNT